MVSWCWTTNIPWAQHHAAEEKIRRDLAGVGTRAHGPRLRRPDGLVVCDEGVWALAYNKDMQQDKDSFADALDVVTASLMMMERMIGTLQAKPEAMEAAVKKGFLNATEVADYLVQHGVPFRDAHGIGTDRYLL